MALLALLTPALDAADSLVWWEGEGPSATNFPARSWFTPANDKEKEALSGGAWLSNSGPRAGDEAYARYTVNAPAAGRYHLWARKFWKHGPFRWRFGQQEWRTCGKDVALADSVELRTHVCANWVYLGQVDLPAGAQQFELRLLAQPGEQLTAAFDCFVLTQGVFVPNGKLKPGERTGRAEPGFFAFEPAVDSFAADAPLDLRCLNEQSAGEKGFLRRAGDRILLGDGRPVRFWAVNVSSNNAAQDRASVDYMARKLAKLGVNMVRYHSPLFSQQGDPAKTDPKKLDDLCYLVAALKKQGIYTTLSFFFPLWFEVKDGYGIEGYSGMQAARAFAILFFDPRMQEIHRAWARQILTTPDPYNGATLAKEPALGMVEIVNEDSLFFWTFNKTNVPLGQWARLEKLFGQWLVVRYGTLEKALAAWGSAKLKEDDARAGVAGLYEAWHMTGQGLAQGGPDKRRRVSDQVRFLTELQRNFYAATAEYLKKDLGYGGLVVASNWQTADPERLGPLERYSYTATDVIDRHGYFGGKHEGEGASYSVRVGHAYQDRAAVKEPERLPVQFDQVLGFPQIISEINWPNPNRFRSDLTFLAASYGALQGVDGIYFFALGSNYVADRGLEKFALASPVIAGAFPATALAYRRADVQEGPPAVSRALKLEDLYALHGGGGAAAGALDELRKKDVSGSKSDAAAPGRLDRLAYYVGPVRSAFDALKLPDTTSLVADAARYMRADMKLVRSATGELRWDWGRGVVTMDTPRAQGAAGFLGAAGAIALRDATIECRNEYAAILIVSLDEQPLASSKRILVQAMTEERPYGFRQENGKIVALGEYPFGVRRIEAHVRLKLQGAGALRVRVLDENGYSRGGAPRTFEAGAAIPLAEDALYQILER
jgi:hypothetical protein